MEPKPASTSGPSAGSSGTRLRLSLRRERMAAIRAKVRPRFVEPAAHRALYVGRHPDPAIGAEVRVVGIRVAASMAGEATPEGSCSRRQMRPRVVAGGRELVCVKTEGLCQRLDIVVRYEGDLARLNVAQPWSVAANHGGNLRLGEAVQPPGVEDQTAKRSAVNIVECTLLQLTPRHWRPINSPHAPQQP